MRGWVSYFRLAFGTALLLGVVAMPSCGRQGPPPPLRNVVLVVVDTLRSDHLRAYGYERETAPVFTRLAREGVRWDGVSPTSWTLPSVASILTGLHPLRHQAIGEADSLPFGATTLAERLGARGYSSLAVIANGWITRKAGFAQGFSSFYSMVGDLKAPTFSTAQQVNAELLPRLQGLKPPFFLYVHYLDPHAPYDPDRDYRGWPLVGRLAARKNGVTVQELRMKEMIDRPAELLADARDLYDGEIRRADSGIGDLLGKLRSLGLDRETLTIVTSDHGEEMVEHGRMGHGLTLYEEVVRVPLVFHAPGHLPAGVHLGVASLLDIVPTILDLLGGKAAPGEMDGTSLAPFMRPQPTPGGLVPAPADRELLLHLDVERDGTALALRDSRYALVLSRRPDRQQLFDLAADPGERSDLLGTEAGRRAMRPLAERLASRYNELSATALPPSASAGPENIEALVALGYLSAPQSHRVRCIPPKIEAAEPPPAAVLGWTGC